MQSGSLRPTCELANRESCESRPTLSEKEGDSRLPRPRVARSDADLPWRASAGARAEKMGSFCQTPLPSYVKLPILIAVGQGASSQPLIDAHVK
jgi:hypothetical protein